MLAIVGWESVLRALLSSSLCWMDGRMVEMVSLKFKAADRLFRTRDDAMQRIGPDLSIRPDKGRSIEGKAEPSQLRRMFC